MTVSVLVPFAERGYGTRGDVWRWLRQNWRREHPDWEVRVGGDRPGEAFSKGRALRHAAGRSSGEVLVLADADSWVGPDVLVDAVSRAEDGVAWVQPHSIVYRLTPFATARVTTGRLPLGAPLLGRDRPREHPAPLGGGIIVLTRDAFEEVGGIDPRMHGWGGEDISFGWALETLVGPHEALGAPLWHLYHEPGLRRRRRRPANEALAGRYSEARGNPEAMRVLVDRVDLPDDEWRRLTSRGAT